MRKYGRRAFFLVIAAVGLAFGIFRSWHSLKVFFTGTRKKVAADNRKTPYSRGGQSMVAVVGGRDVKAMVQRAVSAIGGFDQLRLREKTALVKPNVVGAMGNPTTTSAELVGTVVALLYANGADKVYVGDMSALIRGGTGKNMEETGIGPAARQAGAETISFEDHGWVSVPVSGRHLDHVEVTEWLFKVDRVINLPVIKTHRYAGYSICLKNLVGTTHFSQRPYLVDRSHWEEVVAELNLAFTFDLHIVDGKRIMVSGGPWQGEVRDTRLVMAGADPVACDAVGLAMIKSFDRWERLADKSPWQMRQVKRAVALGLGTADPTRMQILAESLNQDPEFKAWIRGMRDLLV